MLKLGSLALGLGSSYFTLTHLKVGLGLMRPTYSLEHDQRVGKPRGSNVNFISKLYCVSCWMGLKTAMFPSLICVC